MNNFNNYEVSETPKKEQWLKSDLGQGIKIALILIGLFGLGNLIGSLTNIERIDNFETVTNQNMIATDTTLPSEYIGSTTETTAFTTSEKTTVTTTKETTTKATTTAVTTTEDTTIDSKAEIVSLFNKSANKVKKNAVKVTRNYENLRYDRSGSDIPAALFVVGKPLINSWLIDHNIPVEYTESDLIKENFPVKGKDWSSKLKTKDVHKANITEKDGKYYIELDLAYCKSPAENTGVCAVMEEVNLEKVKELAGIVTACETEYYDCKVECVIEKDTGNMVYVKYTQPMILNLTAGRVRDMQATFAMSIESEYVIEY